MKIRFAAVHDRNSWRVHSVHQTIDAAISGPDGAERLLRRDGRVADMWKKHGDVRAVFVWRDGADDATGLRLSPGEGLSIERISLPVEFVDGFKRGRGPSLHDIDNWFSGRPEAPVESLARAAAMKYRYGDLPTWQVVLNAVKAIPRPASAAEVGDYICERISDFARANLSPDLSVLSVNCASRGHHAVNRTPRRTDTKNAYDALIRLKDGERSDVRYELYDPEVHGVWELVDLGGKSLVPRFVQHADDRELDSAREEAERDGLFALGVDARRKVVAMIVQREGQPAFRNALLAAYGGRCVVTGCLVEALLEAAHIVPYQGVHTNGVENGLLLRADIHKLFDMHLLHVDAETRTVRISSELRGSEYESFDGVRIRDPLLKDQSPSRMALQHHAERCGWVHELVDER